MCMLRRLMMRSLSDTHVPETSTLFELPPLPRLFWRGIFVLLIRFVL